MIVSVLAGLIVLASAGSAFAYEFGDYYILDGSSLRGTRADIDVTSISPNSGECIAFSSVVSAANSSAQLEVMKAQCNNAEIDSAACSATSIEFLVERISSTGAKTCYAHNYTSTGSTDLVTVDDSSGAGTWYTYIDGTQYEGQSGYTDTEVQEDEWGEYTGSSCLGSWSAAASFTSWQTYNGSSWGTPSASGPDQQCWRVSSLSGTSSYSFTVQYP